MRKWSRIQSSALTLMAFAVALFLAATAWGQQAKSVADEAKGGPVIRTYGANGGYRTEVTSETKGTLSEEDRRQVAVLTSQVFQHIHEARRAIDADEIKLARREVDKGRQAMKAIRALMPKTAVRTVTKAPDGKVAYEDEREVQDDTVPLFEGMLHAETLAPIIEAKRDAVDVKGVRLVGSELISTEALADLGMVEAQLQRAAKALEENKSQVASAALALAQIRGVEIRYSKEDVPLAEARDAIWLARRSLEENNAEQARFNLHEARQRLRVYREIAPQERRSDVDKLLKETDKLEDQLHGETAQNPASSSDRTRQGNAVTRWWEQINGWVKKHL